MKNHHCTLNLVITVIVLLTPAIIAEAQDTSPSTGSEVHMVVTVETRHGAEVPVLRRDDALVYEGHDRDKVTDWVPLQEDHAGLDLFILLDDASNTGIGSQLEDIRQFIKAEPSTTRMGASRGSMAEG